MEEKVIKKKERSAAYPSYSLPQAIKDVEKLKEKLGKTPYSREAAAEALGYKGVNGNSASRIASCVHFGVLLRSNSTYVQSELADRILRSETQEERREAIIEALRTPNLYDKLIEEFNGSALPSMLDNILVRRYGIADKASKNAAQIFRESAEYATVLYNGIILADGVRDSSSCEEENIAEEVKPSGIPTTTRNNYDLPNINEAMIINQGGKVRGINESGQGWSLNVSLKYEVELPRELRKKVNVLLDSADDIVDALNSLSNAKGKDEEA